jgi:hypothetical protein
MPSEEQMLIATDLAWPAIYQPSREPATNTVYHGAPTGWFRLNLLLATLVGADSIEERRSASRRASHAVYGSAGTVRATSICAS